MASEEEKMLAGQNYSANDPALLAKRQEARRLTEALNRAVPHSEECKEALANLFPCCRGTSAVVESPFFCDYGKDFVKIGKNFYANFGCIFLDGGGITIGDDVKLGPNVQLYTAGHPLDPKIRCEDLLEFAKPIVIGNRVWIGGGVIVTPGVTIGEEAVIGAGSVVTRDIPAGMVAAGNPCRTLRPVGSGKNDS